MRPNQNLMARNYGDYGGSNDNDNNSGSDDGYDDDGEPDKNLTVTPFAEIQGTLEKVFGNENTFGQSLGISWENVELVDGCLYHDPEKDNYKVFSWKDVVGVMPGESEFTSDDANKFLVKNYGGTEKRYELVTAVHPDHDDPEDIGGAVMWYSGGDYGPKSAAKTLAQLLTTRGRNMVVRDDNDNVSEDINNWLTDTSGSDLTRPDLEGRRLAFFEIKKESNSSDRMYHHPIVEDVETGSNITVNNDANSDSTQGSLTGENGAEAAADGGTVAAQGNGSGGPTAGESRREELEAMSYTELQSLGAETEGASGNGTKDEIVEAILDAENGIPVAETETGVPEPITDFVSSVDQFDDFTEDRARTLLDDFVEDDGLPLTQDLVDDYGGREAVLAEAGF